MNRNKRNTGFLIFCFFIYLFFIVIFFYHYFLTKDLCRSIPEWNNWFDRQMHPWTIAFEYISLLLDVSQKILKTIVPELRLYDASYAFLHKIEWLRQMKKKQNLDINRMALCYTPNILCHLKLFELVEIFKHPGFSFAYSQRRYYVVLI